MTIKNIEYPLIIEDVQVRLFRIPPKEKWEDATHRVSAIEIIVLELKAAGHLARGFSYTVGIGGTAVRALLRDYCAAELIGKDARQIVEIWQSMFQHLHRLGSGAVTTLALAAIDSALWELRCQSSRRPLFIEAGGGRNDIPVYTSGIDLHLSPTQLGEELGVLKKDGFEWFKIKVGKENLSEEIARLEAAREAIGDEAKLLLDANQAWDLSEAIRRARAFEKFNPYWLEEPLAPEDIHGHATLKQKTVIPLAVGESLYNIGSFQQYLDADAIDIFQPDVARVGGLTPWLQITALASAHRKPVAPHFLAEISLHALCVIDNGLVLEHVRGGSLHDLGLAEKPIHVERGKASPNLTSGHGVDFILEGINSAFEVAETGYVFDEIRSHID